MIGKILLAGFVCAGIAMAQSPNPPKAAAPMTPAAAKVYAFDVVSIRHNISEENGDIGKVTADGYRMINNLVYVVIRTAYLPQTAGSTHYSLGQMKGLPGWVNTEKYDLDARISGEDRAAWQNPAEQKAMLQSMLQTMLVEKGGPKFKVTDPTVEHPGGMPMPWGGVLFPGGMNGDGMRMYGASMTTFASYVSSILSNMGLKEVTVQDKTGLTGKYDITIKRPAPSESAPGEQQDGTAASDPGGISIYSRLKDLGLMLESGEGQVETLVIDHIERPSAN